MKLFRKISLWALGFAILTFIIFNGFDFLKNKGHFEKITFQPVPISSEEKKNDCFYLGTYIPDITRNQSLEKLNSLETKIGADFNVVSIYQNWGPESVERFPMALLQSIQQNGAIPLITWEPWTYTFPEFESNEELRQNQYLFKYILAGTFDRYLDAYAEKLIAYNEPVFLRFAHEMDNPAYSWSSSGGNTAEDFIAGWRYVVNFFNKKGVANVTWVWNPWEDDAIDSYYPGKDFVDWIGATGLNYGKAASDGNWYDFKDLYRPFSKKFKKYGKPVLISEFGSTNFGGDRGRWLDRALQDISAEFEEVQGVVFFYSDEDKNWGPNPWRPKNSNGMIDWTFATEQNVLDVLNKNFQKKYFKSCTFPSLSDLLITHTPAPRASFLKEKPGGQFDLIINDQNFYIKGVAYNPGHDWRDGDYALTRYQIDEDFRQIKAMGGNTIRRYGTTRYDELIFAAATENDLKVLFGFWFEPEVDYFQDTSKLQEYEAKVLDFVKKYQDQSAILGWTLGNEVWGLSKHSFQQPYLTVVRNHYLLFVEKLAKKIKEIDPQRPVLVAMEHSQQLAGALLQVTQMAPSLDAVGVNVFYQPSIRSLDSVFQKINKPYVVTEFGPEGYWDEYLNNFNEKEQLNELDGTTKANAYAEKWAQYILPHRGKNLGGVAYCWRDRYEGSFTWFGITDMGNRKKPTYFALKNVWTGSSIEFPLKPCYIFAPEFPYESEKEYTFYGIHDEMTNNDITLEWNIYTENMHSVKNYFFKEKENGRKIIVEFPDQTESYRIYLVVSDGEGNCNSFSMPVDIYSTEMLSQK